MILLSGNVVADFAQSVVEGIKANIKGKQVTPFGAMHSTGHAEDSLHWRIVGNSLQIYSTWAYITVLEDGRKPGKYAPPEVIEKWIEDKPIKTEISKKSLAFLINRKLKEEGSLIWQKGGHSGVLSDYTNSEYIHTNLTVPYAKSVANEVANLLFPSRGA